jgi:hypothetical protein
MRSCRRARLPWPPPCSSALFARLFMRRRCWALPRSHCRARLPRPPPRSSALALLRALSSAASACDWDEHACVSRCFRFSQRGRPRRLVRPPGTDPRPLAPRAATRALVAVRAASRGPAQPPSAYLTPPRVARGHLLCFLPPLLSPSSVSIRALSSWSTSELPAYVGTSDEHTRLRRACATLHCCALHGSALLCSALRPSAALFSCELLCFSSP